MRGCAFYLGLFLLIFGIWGFAANLYKNLEFQRGAKREQAVVVSVEGTDHIVTLQLDPPSVSPGAHSLLAERFVGEKGDQVTVDVNPAAREPVQLTGLAGPLGDILRAGIWFVLGMVVLVVLFFTRPPKRQVATLPPVGDKGVDRREVNDD